MILRKLAHPKRDKSVRSESTFEVLYFHNLLKSTQNSFFSSKASLLSRHIIWPTFIRKPPRIFVLPTQLQIFIEISRIELPGNQIKIFISSDSASFTDSETLFRLQKISTGKKLASRNSA